MRRRATEPTPRVSDDKKPARGTGPTASRQQKRREERLKLIEEQVADGTLTIRQMTPAGAQGEPAQEPPQEEALLAPSDRDPVVAGVEAVRPPAELQPGPRPVVGVDAGFVDVPVGAAAGHPGRVAAALLHLAPPLGLASRAAVRGSGSRPRAAARSRRARSGTGTRGCRGPSPSRGWCWARRGRTCSGSR